MLLHFPAKLRPAIAALWRIDEAMAAVVDRASSGATEPALAAIKLAWWREALVHLDTADTPPEPRLKAVAEQLLPLGVSGAEVAQLEQGWSAMLGPHPEPARIGERGQRLFALEARLLGCDDPLLSDAGALTALTEALHRGHDFFAARETLIARLAGHRVARKARPITLAARLAARDPAEPQGTPGRALALILHRLNGNITGARPAGRSG